MAVTIVTPFASDNNPAALGSVVNLFGEATTDIGWLDPVNNTPEGSGYPTISNHTKTTVEMTGNGGSDETAWGIGYPQYSLSGSPFYLKATVEKGNSSANPPVVTMQVIHDTLGSGWFRLELRDDLTYPSVRVNGTNYFATSLNLSSPVTYEIIGDSSSNLWYVDCTQGVTTQTLTISNNPLVTSGAITLKIFVTKDTETNISDFAVTGLSSDITYSLKKGGVEIATTNSYQIAFFQQSDEDTYELFADDGTGAISVGSVSQAIEILSKTISNGGQSISFKAGKGYKTEYELNMFKVVDSLGMIKWVDMGNEFDTFKTSLNSEIIDTDLQTFENMLKGEYAPDYYLAENISGFYPFTPYFDYSAGVRFSLVNRPNPKEVNIYGDAAQYDLEIIPAYDNDIFTDLAAAGAIPECSAVPQNWQIATGLWLPYPDNRFDEVSLNQSNIATQTNGGYSSTYHIKKSNGEVTSISIEVEEEIARQLMVHFSTVRGGTSTAFFQTGYSPFGHLYPDNNYFTVRLADSVVVFTHLNTGRVKVEFSIQMVEVVS